MLHSKLPWKAPFTKKPSREGKILDVYREPVACVIGGTECEAVSGGEIFLDEFLAGVFSSELGESRVRIADGIIALTLWNSDVGTPLTTGSGDPEPLGTLSFHLADFAAIGAFTWHTVAEIDGVTFDATIVDPSLNDHRPTTRSGEHAFVRGNSNGDIRVDISDAVFTLTFLFIAGLGPSCEDAADANNDSAVDISDPVFTLNYLFTGGRVIPAPFPVCGLDEGPVDLLGCSPTAPCAQ